MNTYENTVTFSKTYGTFNGLSNVSAGFPLLINNFRIRNCENFFHALKFSNYPDLQHHVLAQTSPMGARNIARRKALKAFIREDWSDIQLEVMAYCIRAKLIWSWVAFGNLLRESAGKEIWENSSKADAFWGVVQSGDGYRGSNHLGRLMMGLRDEYLSDVNESLHVLTPPNLGLRLGGEELRVVDRRKHLMKIGTRKTAEIEPLMSYWTVCTPTTLQSQKEHEVALVN